MKFSIRMARRLFVAAAFALLVGSPTAPAHAHCDSMDGPVVLAGRRALATRSAEPVLRWVRAGDEPEIRRALAEALKVRELGPEAESLADRFFLETLVRVHRRGEGEPYTGLKPAGGIRPAIAAADRALAEGDVDALAEKIAARVEEEVRRRFRAALETRDAADGSVEAGRDHVAAYVEYVHFVEAIHAVLSGHGHGEEAGGREDHR
jgi:hypothetical protein